MRYKRSICSLVLVGLALLVRHAWSDEPAPKAEEGSAAKPADTKPADDAILLPNGWKLTLAGRQVIITDLPLNILAAPDGRYAFVATSGYNSHDLTAVELATGNKVAT